MTTPGESHARAAKSEQSDANRRGRSTSDDETLALVAATDRAAFAELYRRQVNGIYRYFMSRVGNVHDAEELTSQTFLAALEGLPHYQSQGKFVIWLFSIARRKAVDYFRTQYHHVSMDLLDEMPSPETLPEDLVIEHNSADQIRTAIRALTPERAEALTLRVLVGLSAAEAGRVMGKSGVAVRMLVHRAMRDLRERLAFAPEVER